MIENAMLNKLIAFALLCLSLASLNACAQKTEPAAATAPAPTAPAAAADAASPKPQLNTSVPWLQAKIWEFQSQPVANPPRVVSKAVYEGKTVYHISAACCDMPSQLFDEDGKLICYPSGGIAGGGDGKCKQFVLDKPAMSTVWQDARAYVPVKRATINLP
jgi:hypothetical protein